MTSFDCWEEATVAMLADRQGQPNQILDQHKRPVQVLPIGVTILGVKQLKVIK